MIVIVVGKVTVGLAQRHIVCWRGFPLTSLSCFVPSSFPAGAGRAR